MSASASFPDDRTEFDEILQDLERDAPRGRSRNPGGHGRLQHVEVDRKIDLLGTREAPSEGVLQTGKVRRTHFLVAPKHDSERVGAVEQRGCIAEFADPKAEVPESRAPGSAQARRSDGTACPNSAGVRAADRNGHRS